MLALMYNKPVSKKQYTVSTFVFSSLEDAQAQIDKWKETGSYNENTIIFEIAAKYKPVMKLVKIK